MRNLTICRTRSFVGCLARMKVYIEDAQSGDTAINGTPCRRLGELKNGESRTFPVDERAAKVYVIADQLTKNYCNEYYQLPEGAEDIILTGRNRFNPASGNAYRFDNNGSEGIEKSRKRGTRIGLIVLIAAVAVGGVVGWMSGRGAVAARAQKEKDFSAGGMTITLNEGFREIKQENYTATYVSGDAAVMALKEEFTLMPGAEDLTLGEYRDLVIRANGLNSAERTVIEGIPAFLYENTNAENGQTYRYTAFVYKAGDAFWLLQFGALKDGSSVDDAQIAQWAKSVRFTN